MKITKTSALTQARLKENLLYNKETGIFTWRDDSENRKKANFPKGKIAGSPNTDGYTQIIIDGVPHRAHRLAWLYMYGKFPKTGIDHIDQSKDNNAIKNLGNYILCYPIFFPITALATFSGVSSMGSTIFVGGLPAFFFCSFFIF